MQPHGGERVFGRGRGDVGRDEAKDLGLIDAVGTIDEYVGGTWGLRTYDFGPNAQSLPLLGRTLQDVIVGSVQRLGGSIPEVR